MRAVGVDKKQQALVVDILKQKPMITRAQAAKAADGKPMRFYEIADDETELPVDSSAGPVVTTRR